jgi:hypothetical protein
VLPVESDAVGVVKAVGDTDAVTVGVRVQDGVPVRV